MNQTITLTSGEQSENHVGMEKHGNGLREGFTKKDLMKIKKKFKDISDCKVHLINLADYIEEEVDDAYILIIKNGVNVILNDIDSENSADDMFNEQLELKWDKKYFDNRRGKVLNKHARYNLCYSKKSQKPDYENKKGRIVEYKDIPITNSVIKEYPNYFGSKAKGLELEGNLYYDIDKCGISFHGDSERRIVIAIRLGAKIPLYFQWFINSKPVSDNLKFNLDHGDMYIMSEKTTGNDWKKSSIYTLRHSAGADKYTKSKDESSKVQILVP